MSRTAANFGASHNVTRRAARRPGADPTWRPARIERRAVATFAGRALARAVREYHDGKACTPGSPFRRARHEAPGDDRAAGDGVDCCGCLVEIVGEESQFVCNECGLTLPTADVQRAVMEMESTEATCPHCGRVNRIDGFSEVDVFVCRYCGERGDRLRDPVYPR